MTRQKCGPIPVYIVSLLVAVLAVNLSGCNGEVVPIPTPTETSAPSTRTRITGYIYHVSHQVAKQVDETFEISENNCGYPLDTEIDITRSRSVDHALALQLSEAVIAEIGAGIPQVAEASVGTEIESIVNVNIGETDTHSFSRRLTVPANSEVIVTFQWWEYWSTGIVAIQYPNGEPLGEVPFRVLKTVYLSQRQILRNDCFVAIPLPDRVVELSQEQALVAQEKVMRALATGALELTESEFSSLLNEFIKLNSVDLPVEVRNVRFWFTPNALYLRVLLVDESNFDLVGNIVSEGNRIAIDLIGASANNIVVAGSTLDIIEQAVNRALNDSSLAIAFSVEMGDGVLKIGSQ